jgi:hypothetical protein
MTLVPSPHNGLRYRIEVWIETWKDPARWPGRTGWKPSTLTSPLRSPGSWTRTSPARRSSSVIRIRNAESDRADVGRLS